MSKIRLLIVDEHVAVRTALEMRLRSSEEIEVVAAAHNLSEGQFRAIDQSPDVVLIGLKSSGRQALDEAVATIKEVADNGIPVVVLASYADDAQREKLLQAGADRYLLKDINSCQLISEITGIAGQAAAPSTA